MQSPNTGPGFHYGWIIALIGMLCVTGALGFGRFGYTRILPSMKTGLYLDEVQAGDLATGTMIGYLIVSITAGFLASWLNPKPVIIFFMILTSAAMFLTGLARNYPEAFLWRLVTGMGSAGVNVPMMGLISAWFTVKHRGLATGMIAGGSSVGLLVSSILVTLIGNWRISWFTLAAIALLITILAILFMKNRPAAKTLLPVATDATPAAISAPVSKLKSVFTSPPVWHLAFIYILFGFAYIIYATFFIRYLSWELNFPEDKASLLWSGIGAVSIVSGFIWGSISDKIGRKYGLALVYFIQSLCFIIFGVWKTLPGVIISSVLFSLTAWSIPAIMSAAAGDILGSKLAPAAVGLLTFFFSTGQVAGPFIAARIAGYTHSYALAFILAGMAALLGGSASLFLRTKPNSTDRIDPSRL